MDLKVLRAVILLLMIQGWIMSSPAADWLKDAKWIGESGETNFAWRLKDAELALGVTGVKGHRLVLTRPLPKDCLRFRKVFPLAGKPIVKATVAVTGLGFYELWLNGRKVDPLRILSPAMTDPEIGAYYDTYDVHAELKSGEKNALGVWLAPGYSDDFSRYGARWLAPQRMILRMDVQYSDGTKDSVISDDSWQSSRRGPIREVGIYRGETYDATMEQPDWSLPVDIVDGWARACVFPDGPKPIKSEMPSVRMSDPRPSISIHETDRGVYTIDFGQNRAGVVWIRAKGARGTRIVIKTSELLGQNGRIDPWTNRDARSTDTFVLAGTGKQETYVPRFTYHGFRYAEISGYPGKLTENDIKAYAVHADVKHTASFLCSDETLNWLHGAATWSMLSNFVSFPTDCCMRDERTACRMDSQAYEDAACQFFDMRSYYAKWLDEGGLPTRGNPDWTGDVVTLPHRLWWHYGEEKPFLARYPAAKSYVGALLKECPDGVWRKGFGDWCAPNNGTWKGYFNDVELVNSAIFCKIVGETAELAERVAENTDAKWFRAAAELAREAFHRTFYHPESATYGDGSQTTAVLPLAFGLVPADCRQNVAESLIRRIRQVDGKKLDTGIYGTRYIGEVLCDLGEVDLLLEMYTQPDYPGFGYMKSCGATTLWEQWRFKGGMNSHNHAMFAGGASWLYSHLAGIRPDRPGYASILVQPVFPKKLNFLNARRRTPHGDVTVDWKRVGSEINLRVVAPNEVPTRLKLPDGRVLDVKGCIQVRI